MLHTIGAETIDNIETAANRLKLSGLDSHSVEISKYQIRNSLLELERLAQGLCFLSPGSAKGLGLGKLGLFNSSHPETRLWASSMSRALKSFITSKLPERQRLAVAIGVSAFVPDRKAYPSFTQPLIDSFIKISDSLAKQIHNEAFLAKVNTFQNFFSKNVDKLTSVRALLDLGSGSTKATFSQLVSATDISLLAMRLSHSHITQFRKNRIIRRIINKADFSVVITTEKSNHCANKEYYCECSGSRVVLNIPIPDPTQACLAKDGINKFINSNLPSIYHFLVNERDSLTLTRGGFGGSRNKQLVTLLKPPYIRIKRQFGGVLVAGAGIFLPNGLPGPISFRCKNATSGILSTYSLTHSLAPGLLRTPAHCLIQSSDGDIVFINPTPSQKLNISKPTLFDSNVTSLLDSELNLFQPLGGWLSNKQIKEIEGGLKNAISAEDFLQGRVKVLESVTWIYWLTWYIAPVLGCLLLIILAVTITYIWFSCNCCCCLCCSRCKSAMPDQGEASDQLSIDIARLKGAFSLFVNSDFEDLELETIKKKLEDKVARQDQNNSENVA